MMLAGLAGKSASKPKLPKRLVPPPCTEGICT